MELTGIEDVDIKLDENGQPILGKTGDFETVQDMECWLQDIKNEILTAEGELFYEDQDGTESYGYSMIEFVQATLDEFTETEMDQRIREKLSKRPEIDDISIQTDMEYRRDGYHIRIKFKRNDAAEEYNIDFDSDEVEVITDDR